MIIVTACVTLCRLPACVILMDHDSLAVCRPWRSTGFRLHLYVAARISVSKRTEYQPEAIEEEEEEEALGVRTRRRLEDPVLHSTRVLLYMKEEKILLLLLLTVLNRSS